MTFGSYGWSGEVVEKLTKDLKEAGFNVVNDGHRSYGFQMMKKQMYSKTTAKNRKRIQVKK